MSMTFYFTPMSSATRVHWALEEVGVPYEKVKVDVAAGDTKKPAFLAMNPNGKIPLLVVEGQPIFESLAQLLWLGEEYGVERNLFPKAGLLRAEAFKWMAWGSCTMMESMARIIRNGERVPEDQRNPHAKAAAILEVRAQFEILDAHLAGKAHILGEPFSLVDCSVASMVPFSARLGVDTNGLDHLNAWVGRCMGRAALGRVMAG